MNLVNALYSTEVQKRIDMGIYKTARVPPKVISSLSVQSAASSVLSEISVQSPSDDVTATGTGCASAPIVADWDRVVWNDEASAKVSQLKIIQFQLLSISS